MILQSKALTELAEADFTILVRDQVSEGKLLDYKRDLPGQSDGDKKEFLFDVSSFANASGGHLIYGIDEDGGVPRQLSGLTVSDADAEIRRLQSLMLDSIDPRIPGLDLRFIPISNGKSLLAISIPKSWTLPHMVTFKGTNKFYSRNAAGKHPLDVDELRDMFVSSDRIADRIKRFRIERVGQILAEETPVPMAPEAKTILHIVPLEAFSSTSKIDLKVACGLPPGLLYPLGAQGYAPRINLEGLLHYTSADQTTGKASAYLQLYRSGIIETVDAKTLAANFTNPFVAARGKIVPSALFERSLVGQIPQYVLALEKLGISPPFVMMLTLNGVRNFAMAAPRGMYSGSFDQDIVIVPEILLDTFDCKPTNIKPLLDPVWNATGAIASPSFDPSGNWLCST